MLCICCLLKSDDRKNFSSIAVADRKLYRELTGLQVKPGKSIICKECKIKLKSSADFRRMCLRSHDRISETVNLGKKTQARRNHKKSDHQTESPSVDECRDNPSSDDEILISTLKQQLQDETKKLEVQAAAIIIELPEKLTEDEKFLCCECGACLLSAEHLQQHRLTHSRLKSFKCDACDKSFATKFRLKAHTRIHTGERPFVCEVCSLSFAQGNALTCHRRVHTKERPFVCKICSKSFSQNTTLKTHMAALHLGKSVECDEPGCDKKFTRRSYLLIHKRDHAGERKYACERCPNQYKQKSHLDRHIEASHLGIRHRCDFPGCSSEFSKAWSLKMHKFAHAEHLPYKCNLCESTFQRRDKLLKHRMKMHPEAADLKSEPIEIRDPVMEAIKADSLENSNFVVLSSTPEVYTIQNSDGTFTQLQTLIQEN